jgi:hypothetical protein
LYKKENEIQKPQKDCTRTAIIVAHAASKVDVFHPEVFIKYIG